MALEKQNYKLTDEEFDIIFRENFGLCALTARAIEKQYGISMSRQAVRERSQKYSQQDKDAMLNDLFDVAGSAIVGHMQGEVCSPSRLRAATLMLNTISKFNSRKTLVPQKPEQVYKIHGKIKSFRK